MSVEEFQGSITYEKIMSLAKAKADQLRSGLPVLPTDEELEPFSRMMWVRDKDLISAVKRHIDVAGFRDNAPNRGFEQHLEWVAVRAAFVAAQECSLRGIFDPGLRNEIIQRTWRLGLLHDIEGRLGWQPMHFQEGARVARRILSELDIVDEDSYLVEQILLHDDLVVEPHDDPRFDVPLYAVFAVDHMLWGKEWEEDRWKNSEAKGVPPLDAVNDEQLICKMQILRDGPNLQQTQWGRKVALEYIKFGLEIAREVQKNFELDLHS